MSAITNSGAFLFEQRIPYTVELEGDVNGQVFSVRGKGFGDATCGKIEAKFICTTGELPVPWASIVTTVTYGAQVFIKYKPGMKDFYKSCMPEGYTQDRTIQFDDDGVYKTHAKVTYENGSIYHRVKLTGEGFQKDGYVLGKKMEFKYNPHCIYIMGNPANNGLKAAFKIVHDIIGGEQKLADHIQYNKPLGGGLNAVPDYHNVTCYTEMSKDAEDPRDNMILHEIFRAVDIEKEYL